MFDNLLGSKPTATLITIAMLVLFCVIVALGWWFQLATYIEVPALLALCAFGITAFAAVLAQRIGQLRADAERAGKPRRWYRGWQAYFFLLPITALGTLNAAFVLFESRSLLRQDVSTVRAAFGTLQDVADKALVPTSYTQRKTRIDALLRNLHEEIVNPNGGNYCGVGGSARVIIAEIKVVIPAYHILNGSGPIKPCDIPKAEGVYASYERMAHEMLADEKEFIAANGPAKLTYLAALHDHKARADIQLQALEQKASGLGSAELINRSDLYAARDQYNVDHSTFVNLNGQDDPRLVNLGSMLSEHVNSYGSIFELLWRRLGNFRSWIYLILALGIDYALIYLITRFNVNYGGPPKPKGAPAPAPSRFTSDPRFLWSAPPRSDY